MRLARSLVPQDDVYSQDHGTDEHCWVSRPCGALPGVSREAERRSSKAESLFAVIVSGRPLRSELFRLLIREELHGC